MKMLSSFCSALAASLVVFSMGCDAPVGSFAANNVYSLTLEHSRQTSTEDARTDVTKVVDSLFGTPDEPLWPSDFVASGLQLDLEKIKRAAGPQLSEKDGTHQGLYREHCVVCHSLSGSGAGPASLFQNPYPRDFRPGVFKWKSTVRDAKPTREDLIAILKHGAPGTGMPSFVLVDPIDIDALVDYVIYLSVRGEVERELLAVAVDDLGYGEDELAADARIKLDTSSEDESEGVAAIKEVIQDVSSQWVQASAQRVTIPSANQLQGDQLAASIENGRKLFHGPIANCFGCHGTNGKNNAATLDYDDWTKEYSTRLGLTPTDRKAMRPFRKAGAFKPRLSQPRPLRLGVFRGGHDAEALYQRITQGIAGTPMPSVKVVKEADGTGLTQAQIFDLIHYVQSLSSSQHDLVSLDTHREQG